MGRPEWKQWRVLSDAIIVLNAKKCESLLDSKESLDELASSMFLFDLSEFMVRLPERCSFFQTGKGSMIFIVSILSCTSVHIRRQFKS